MAKVARVENAIARIVENSCDGAWAYYREVNLSVRRKTREQTRRPNAPVGRLPPMRFRNWRQVAEGHEEIEKFYIVWGARKPFEADVPGSGVLRH